MSEQAKIAVLGAGAWGTALAMVARRAGHRVTLIARDEANARTIREAGENARYLPGIALDPAIRVTGRAAEAVADAHCLLAAVPAQALRAALGEVAPAIRPAASVVLCAKGIEASTGSLLSEIVTGVLPGHSVAALSGPSFATDVARGLPTAVVVADRDGDQAAALAALLSTPGFRCYSTDDLTGVEIGGALKNVIALAAGAVMGAGLGASAQAALVTRGFVELRRMAASFGARPETLMGLSGLGDLMLTCSSAQSRNFAYGLALGRGDPLEGLKLAEGVATSGVAARLAAERGIEVPIIATVRLLLDRALTIREAVERLMSRPLRSEDE